MTTATLPVPTFQYKTPPLDHQRKALRRMSSKPEAAFFMEAGTMKTFIALNDAAYHWQQGDIDTLLVFAPGGVHEQWIEEQIPMHLPDWVKRTAIASKTGSKRVEREMNEAVKTEGRLVILAFNHEVLQSEKGLKFVISLIKNRRTMIYVDESHRFKTPSAIRTRNLWKLRAWSKYRRIMTGTETAKGYEDLYSQLRFLNPDIIGCHTFTAFKTQYCVLDEFYRVQSYRNIEELKRRIAPYCFVAELKDCFDLPPDNYEDVIVTMTKEQTELYMKIRDEYIAEVSTGQVIEAPLAITRLQKLQQIAGGHIQLGEGKWLPIPNNSVDATIERVRGASGKVIVWGEWQPDIIQISAGLDAAGVSYVTCYGANSKAANKANVDRFKTDPSVKVLVATPASGGTGFNLQMASTAIFYTLSFNYVNYNQAIRRIRRGGQTSPQVFIFLIRPGTVDRKLVASRKRKEKIGAELRDPLVFKDWLLAA